MFFSRCLCQMIKSKVLRMLQKRKPRDYRLDAEDQEGVRVEEGEVEIV